MSARRPIVPALLALLLLACSDGEMPGPWAVCTEEFRSWVVTVVDDALTPVAGLEVDVTRASTGEPLPYGEPMLQPGSYRIMDDGMSDELEIDGETILVEGAGQGISFEAEYVFGTDAQRCHVEKVSGPDTVVVGG
jgi:hypothetical protein